MVFGSIPDQIVVAIDDPVIAPESADADRVVLTLRTVASPGAVRRFAKQVVIPRLKNIPACSSRATTSTTATIPSTATTRSRRIRRSRSP